MNQLRITHTNLRTDRWKACKHVFLAALAILSMLSRLATAEGPASEDKDGQKQEEQKGPHRGKMLRQEEFALEVTIFEKGTPPEFRVFPSASGRPIPPAEVSLEVTLKRLGGRTDTLRFSPEHDYLVSDGEVVEPHSFDVAFAAKRDGRSYTFNYSTYEGRTELTRRAIEAAGVVSEVAGPQTISDELVLTGKIDPSEHRIAHIIPRFPGVVREGRKHIGDRVEQGEVVAVIESNESLQPYEVRSPITGTIISGHLVPREYIGQGQIAFVVADMAEVWGDFRIYSKDADKVKGGQRLLVKADVLPQPLPATVWYVSPYADERTQSRFVRAVIPNADLALFPGMFASAALEVDPKKVPVAVKTSAIQTYRDWKAVFIQDGNTFEVQPIELGAANEEWTEVKSGLEPGMHYVSQNSFIIKADILKSGATHDH